MNGKDISKRRVEIGELPGRGPESGSGAFRRVTLCPSVFIRVSNTVDGVMS
jgi:hypothetical protein